METQLNWMNTEDFQKTALHTCFLQICVDGPLISRRSTALTPTRRHMPPSHNVTEPVPRLGRGYGIECLLLVQGWVEMSSEISSARTGRERRRWEEDDKGRREMKGRDFFKQNVFCSCEKLGCYPHILLEKT